MRRMDLFLTAHKGIRSVLFETARQVARTDFSDPAQSGAAAGAVRRMSGFLRVHSEHEDRVIFPQVERLGASVAAELHADHSRVRGLEEEIERYVERLEGADEGERVALGQRIHEKMGRLVAEHLLHMEREETTANRLLWAHLTDEDLRALLGQILGATSPEQMTRWAEVLVPSISPVEREHFLGALRGSLSGEQASRLNAVLENAGR